VCYAFFNFLNGEERSVCINTCKILLIIRKRLINGIQILFPFPLKFLHRYNYDRMKRKKLIKNVCQQFGDLSQIFLFDFFLSFDGFIILLEAGRKLSFERLC